MSIVDSATSFEELKQGLYFKTTNLQILNQIRGGWGTDTMDEIVTYSDEIRTMSRTLISFKTILQNGRREIEELKKYLLDLDQLCERLSHMYNNLPAHVPRVQINPQSCTEEENSGLNVHKNVEAPASKYPKKANECKSKNVQEHAKDESKAPKQPKVIAKLEYITLDEFESVPKYTKGRIAYEKVNAAIDSLNKAIEGKYNLIKKPRAKLTPIEHSMVTEYKRQINPECKGMHFVTDDDLKQHANMKLDTSARSILTILRTLKRLKEVRGPGSLMRYCIL